MSKRDHPTPAAKCGAKTRRGTRCKTPAGWGTDHFGFGPCKKHGGLLPSVRQSAREAMALAELRFMGVALDVEPTDALLTCVRTAAGHLAYLTRKVEEVPPGGELQQAPNQNGQVLHVWARLQQDAIERLARVCKMALDAGVAERRVRLAERAGQQIAAAIERALEGMDLSNAQRAELGRRVSVELAVLEATDETTIDGTGQVA